MLFAVIGWSDYLDGIAARVTGQYSRMGALLDPLVDRLLVISGVDRVLELRAAAALGARRCWPRASCSCSCLARYALHRGVDLKINWLGRAGVWPVFSALFFAHVRSATGWRLRCLYVGLVLVLGVDGRSTFATVSRQARLQAST